MADEKPTTDNANLAIEAGLVILAIIALPILLSSKGGPTPTYLNIEFFFYKFYVFMSAIWHFLKNGSWINLAEIILSIIAVVAIAVISYSHIRSGQKDKHFRDAVSIYTPPEAAISGERSQWQQIQSQIASPQESEWRLAIIEADTMLDRLLQDRGYPGGNIGERLQGANPNNFRTLQNAWEAHKVRNRIAHEGSNFVLTRPEARTTISNFEAVFREFNYI